MTLTAEPTTTGATAPAGDHLERARTAAAVVRAEADEIERTTTITPTAYEAIAEQKLFWAMIPEEYGGDGLGLVSAFEIIEELTRADASTGWAFMANSLSMAIAVGFLAEEGAREIFDQPAPGITAGMILPTGKGRRVDGGYVVTGNYQFASGSAHASWIGAGFVVTDADGNPETSPDGQPVCRTAFVPRDEVEFRGNWDVLGMVGTGSYDYGVTEVFVPERRAFDTFSTTPVRPEPVYRLGLLGIGVGGHAPVALGLARRALDEIAAIATTKARPGYPTVIGDSDLFRLEFAKAEALYQAARLYVYDTHASAEASANAGEPISEEQFARLRQAVTWVQEVATEVVGFAHRWGGSQSIRNPSVLGRCTRDAAVATQHLLVDPMTLVDAAPAIIAGYGTA